MFLEHIADYAVFFFSRAVAIRLALALLAGLAFVTFLLCVNNFYLICQEARWREGKPSIYDEG